MKLTLQQVLAGLAPETHPIVQGLLLAAEEREVEVYLVGGPLRDVILGRPVVDVDLMIDPGERTTAEELARAGAPNTATLRVFERFATVAISTPDASVDLATVRSESYAHPGALPVVAPGTLTEDLQRRDFGVNALALPLVRSRKPVAVIDPFGGLEDLARRRLRILHPRSFHDDPTRALRAARLGPRLGFSLSRASHTALQNALRDGAFGAVSGERLRREFEKLFDDASRDLDPAVALRRLSDWHVLGALEPGLELPREVAAPLRRLGRSLVEAPWRGPRYRRWAAGLAVWLAPLTPARRRRVLERLAVRGEVRDRISKLPERMDSLLDSLAAAHGRGAVDALLDGIDELQLFALHAWAPTPVRRRIVRWAAEDRALRMPIGGDDLAALGFSGPPVGQILTRVRAAVLDGAVANREEALALARELGRQPEVSRRSARKRPPARRRKAAASKGPAKTAGPSRRPKLRKKSGKKPAKGGAKKGAKNPGKTSGQRSAASSAQLPSR